jgi:hypothetical protein
VLGFVLSCTTDTGVSKQKLESKSPPPEKTCAEIQAQSDMTTVPLLVQTLTDAIKKAVPDKVTIVRVKGLGRDLARIDANLGVEDNLKARLEVALKNTSARVFNAPGFPSDKICVAAFLLNAQNLKITFKGKIVYTDFANRDFDYGTFDVTLPISIDVKAVSFPSFVSYQPTVKIKISAYPAVRSIFFSTIEESSCHVTGKVWDVIPIMSDSSCKSKILGAINDAIPEKNARLIDSSKLCTSNQVEIAFGVTPTTTLTGPFPIEPVACEACWNEIDESCAPSIRTNSDANCWADACKDGVLSIGGPP